MAMQWQRDLPEAQGSKTVKEQQIELYRSRVFRSTGGAEYQARLLARWDDQCGNGSNSFYLYKQVVMAHSNRESERFSWSDISAAILADVPADRLALERYNGFHPFGPWYYIENTLSHAGDKDYNGLRKGERKQIVNGKTGVPAWKLVAISSWDGEEVDISSLTQYKDSDTHPLCEYRLEYRPWCHIGQGKERQLDYARSTACWPDATDDQLMDENLATALRMRLPGLLVQFRKDIEAVGFKW